MSYDIEMRVNTGGGATHALLGFEHNCTYNLAPMFEKAFATAGSEGWFDKAFGGAPGTGLRLLEGKTGAEALPLLEIAIKSMEAFPEEYKALNPSNGWGTYEGALETIQELLSWAVEAPLARFRVA